MKRYDKSLIMKRAWNIYNRSWNVTFSDALKEAWRRTKEEVAMQEKLGNRYERTSYDRRNAREFAHVRFGKNDWAFLYGRKY